MIRPRSIHRGWVLLPRGNAVPDADVWMRDQDVIVFWDGMQVAVMQGCRFDYVAGSRQVIITSGDGRQIRTLRHPRPPRWSRS